MPAKQLTVILAEDEQVLADMYATKLRKEGIDVVVAYNGQEVLDAAKKSRPDLILLDLVMPVMDGFEALQALRADPATKDNKIYIFTNLSQEEDRRKAKELGADGYLVKADYTPSQISQYIQTLANK